MKEVCSPCTAGHACQRLLQLTKRRPPPPMNAPKPTTLKTLLPPSPPFCPRTQQQQQHDTSPCPHMPVHLHGSHRFSMRQSQLYSSSRRYLCVEMCDRVMMKYKSHTCDRVTSTQCERRRELVWESTFRKQPLCLSTASHTQHIQRAVEPACLPGQDCPQIHTSSHPKHNPPLLSATHINSPAQVLPAFCCLEHPLAQGHRCCGCLCCCCRPCRRPHPYEACGVRVGGVVGLGVCVG